MWLKRKYFIELRWSRKIGPEIGSRGWEVWGRGWRRGNKSYLESSSFSPSKADEQNWNNEKINEKHKGCIKCGQNWTTMNCYAVDDMADFASKLRAKMTLRAEPTLLHPWPTIKTMNWNNKSNIDFFTWHLESNVMRASFS